MTQSQENDQKPILGPKFGLFWPIIGQNIFFNPSDNYHLLDIMHVYHHTQNQEKVMTQSPENGQKRHYGPNFGHFWPLV